jgi:hypothetical protein
LCFSKKKKKRTLKEEEGLLGLYFGLLAFCSGGLFPFEYWEEVFTLGFLVWKGFGREKNY